MDDFIEPKRQDVLSRPAIPVVSIGLSITVLNEKRGRLYLGGTSFPIAGASILSVQEHGQGWLNSSRIQVQRVSCLRAVILVIGNPSNIIPHLLELCMW